MKTFAYFVLSLIIVSTGWVTIPVVVGMVNETMNESVPQTGPAPKRAR